ncbi:MAG: hypothetical protein HOE43_10450 [Chloroflexi bacterium]|jgi:adenylate kinase family enzyme|nr:hypothetical protein [Chloroflexota bacterium]MBT4942941.1 hypothetical protein [Chloroflexota bacterium]
MPNIRKIYIAGGSGTGKTRLSRLIGEPTGYPVLELDSILWHHPDTGERITPSERSSIVHNEAVKPSWIADGVYVNWVQELWREADLVIYISVGLRLMLWRVFWRHVKAELRRSNPHSGWRNLFKFMGVIKKSYRSSEIGNIDDDEDETLSEAKIAAKAKQQEHKVLRVGNNPNIDEILAMIADK